MFVASQILIVIGAFFDCLSRLSKSKKQMLVLLIIACSIYASSYVFLQSWAAVISFLSGVLRSIVYYYVEKKPSKQKNLIACICLSTLIVAIIAICWSGPKDFLMISAALSLTLVFAQNNLIIIRIGMIITSLSNLTYDIIIGSYMAIVIDIVLLISVVYSLAFLDILKKENIFLKWFRKLIPNSKFNSSNKIE